MALTQTRMIEKQASLVAELLEIPLGRLRLLLAYFNEDFLRAFGVHRSLTATSASGLQFLPCSASVSSKSTDVAAPLALPQPTPRAAFRCRHCAAAIWRPSRAWLRG
ncbi:hypothetical protein HNR29_006539 [Rhizobium leguminosarum]|nr:hypothetical protein [Rhizobium leguminosarum]